jgi:hypothetical protein
VPRCEQLGLLPGWPRSADTPSGTETGARRADAFRSCRGRWPDRYCGPVPGALGEAWLAVDTALFRVVLIEHPVRPGFRLVDTAKPAETARNVYRFELKVPAGQTAKETVTEERNVGSAVQLTNSPDEQIRLFLQSPVVSDKVKEGLKKAQEPRREWAKTQREVAERQRQLQAVAEDQTRLRADLREVPQTSPLHRRYLDKLGRREDEAEKYRAEVQKLQEQEHARRKALDDSLAAFSAE